MNDKHKTFDKGYHAILRSNEIYTKHQSRLDHIYARPKSRSETDWQRSQTVKQHRSRDHNKQLTQAQHSVRAGNNLMLHRLEDIRLRDPVYTKHGAVTQMPAAQPEYQRFQLKLKSLQKKKEYSKIRQANLKLAERIESQ